MSEQLYNYDQEENLPVSSKWTMDAAGETGRAVIPNILMIITKDTHSKGSGFLLNNGYVVTNHHVLVDAKVCNIIGMFSNKKYISFSEVYYNKNLDLALLKPTTKLQGGLSLDSSKDAKIGELVHTWGYPLGYNGPSPLFSAGYLSGFKEQFNNDKQVKHLVINGAFNNGNSGGALFRSGSDKVIGIVVTKHMPLSDFHQAAINGLANNRNGVIFTATYSNGQSEKMTESQVVADILMAYQPLVQVMIGEAICASELEDFLKEVKK